MMAFGVLANASSSEDSKASAARTIKELSEQHRAQLDDMRDVCLQHKGLDILIDLLRHDDEEALARFLASAKALREQVPPPAA